MFVTLTFTPLKFAAANAILLRVSSESLEERHLYGLKKIFFYLVL